MEKHDSIVHVSILRFSFVDSFLKYMIGIQFQQISKHNDYVCVCVGGGLFWEEGGT